MRDSEAVRASERQVAIDLARGVAILLMTFDHAGAMARVNLLFEHYEGRTTELARWPLWPVGLLTNLASPLFWVLSGISVAILARSYRRRTGSERAATAFLFTRGGVLLLLDAAVISFLWAPVLHFKSTYTFDLLSSLSVSLVLLSLLRLLPRGVFAAITFGLLIGFWWIRAAVPDAWREAGGFWVWLWFDHVGAEHPVVSFPVLGWFGLMAFGYLIGDRMTRPEWRHPRRWMLISLGLFACWAVLRFVGIMTHQVQWRPGDGFLEYWVMSKGPPSPLYLMFNLGGAALVYAGALALGDRTHRAPWSWLVTLGKASLFVYVMHLILYKAFAWMGYRIAHEHHSWRLLVTWLPGVIVLIPMAAWYRRLKERHHDSVLKYL